MNLDLGEEALAADLLVEHLRRTDAPQELVEQARRQAAELRSREERPSGQQPPGAAQTRVATH